MSTVFAKHVRRADPRLVALRLAFLGLLFVPALGAASARANTTGGAAATASTATSESTAGDTSSGGAAPTDPPQTGKAALATWFGPGFYGDQTACGQTMSPALIGVASRTLPCGTLVQIGYHGRHLTVPVLDRGPYGHIGAVWDLTAGTARALKIKETVRVTTAIVGSLPNTPALGQPEESSLTGAETAPASSAAIPSAASSTGGAAAAN